MPVTTSAHVSSITEGERLEADARLVVAPEGGVFEPAADLNAGTSITAGQVIGLVRSGSQAVPVVSPFSGRAGDTLAWQGERLTPHQPVMWLSLDAGRP